MKTVFLIERLVARLVADKKLSQNLVFKGGFVGLKVYGSPRYTIDLDALLVKSNIDSTFELVKQSAEMDSEDGTWFRFESQINLITQGEYGGIRQVFRVGIGEILPDIKRAQTIFFDLGIGDPITPGPKKAQTPSLFPQNEDISWSVYPIETIMRSVSSLWSSARFLSKRGVEEAASRGRFRSFVSMNHPYQLVITVPSDLAGQRRTSKLTASDSWRLPAGTPAIYVTIGVTQKIHPTFADIFLRRNTQSFRSYD